MKRPREAAPRSRVSAATRGRPDPLRHREAAPRSRVSAATRGRPDPLRHLVNLRHLLNLLRGDLLHRGRHLLHRGRHLLHRGRHLLHRGRHLLHRGRLPSRGFTLRPSRRPPPILKRLHRHRFTIHRCPPLSMAIHRCPWRLMSSCWQSSGGGSPPHISNEKLECHALAGLSSPTGRRTVAEC